MGTVFAGIAIGPAIGSLSIQITGNPLTPFYAAFIVHCLQVLLNAIIMPESLPKEKQMKARQIYDEKKEEKARSAREDARKAEREKYGFIKKSWIAMKNFARPVTTVFAPLALLGPRQRENGGLDWSLPILAITTGLYSMMMVSRLYRSLRFISLRCTNFSISSSCLLALSQSIPSRCSTPNSNSVGQVSN